MPGRRRALVGAIAGVACWAWSCALTYPFDELTNGDASTASDGAAGDDDAADGFVDTTVETSTGADGSLDVAGDAGLAFFDDFNRPDSAVIGNGWIMKNPNEFVLSGGEVVVQGGSGSAYQNNVFYRPAGEDILDVEASVELRDLKGNPPGFPQVFVRVKSSTVGFANTLDAYMLFIANTTNNATLARQHGTNIYTTLTGISLTLGIDSTHTF